MNKFILVLVALITSAGCFAQSDLATFNLKKGVTKCIGTMYDNPNPGAGTTLTFSDKGTLLTIGGQSVSEISNYEVKRDGKGRIASIGYMEGESFNTATFSYDADGRVCAIRTHWLNMDTDDKGLVSDAQLMWNDKGELYQIDVTDADGNCINHMYEYTSYDEKGNWIVCVHKDSNGNESQESRALSYGTNAVSETSTDSRQVSASASAADSGIDNALKSDSSSNSSSALKTSYNVSQR